MDGVLYPFSEVLGDYIAEHTDGRKRPTPTRWETWMDWGMSKDAWDTWFDAAIKEELLFRVGRPLPGSIEVLENLMDAGHFVRLVTDKTRSTRFTTNLARLNTIEWIMDWGIPHHALSFNHYDEGKHDYIADVVIDDRPSCKEWAQRDALNILFGQPWNAVWDYDALAPVKRVHNGWEGVLSLIDAA